MSSKCGPYALRPIEMDSSSSRASPPRPAVIARADTPEFGRHSGEPGPGKRMTRGDYSKELQCFATTRSSVHERAQENPDPPRRLRSSKDLPIQDQRKNIR